MVIAMLGSVVPVFYPITLGEIPPGGHGPVFPAPGNWIESPVVSACVNLGVTIGLALLMSLLNRTFNLLRATTALDASFFLLMCLSTPRVLLRFSTGTMLCLVILTCLFILYRIYGDPDATRSVFIIFFILSAASMCRLAFAVYIPVFLVGLGQMRAFNGRTATAAFLGLLTPWWIIFGAGLIWPQLLPLHHWGVDFQLPDFSTWGLVLATTAITGILLIAGWVLNFPQMIAYNAHMRAYNGTTSLVAVATLIAATLFASDIFLFAPALYMCAAFQLGRLLAGRAARFSVSAIAVIFAIYLILYLCNLANIIL